MGFTLTSTVTNQTNGLQPTFLMNQGFPSYQVPPFINPSVSNGTSVSWWQGAETTHPPTTDNFNFSIQRQLGPNMLLRPPMMAYPALTSRPNYSITIRTILRLLTAFGNIAQSTSVLTATSVRT